MNEYKKLSPKKINLTLQRLNDRIKERFPDAGLVKICDELVTIAKESEQKAKWIGTPNRLIRTGIFCVIVLLFITITTAVIKLNLPFSQMTLPDFIQVCEAGMNIVVFLGISLVFLVTLEIRIKRNRAMKAIHELRVIIHIIDMHQLTKDPEWILEGGKETASSPKRKMSTFELSRYLDYCTEMLSLIGNIATLYAQDFEDTAVVNAVSGIDVLTVGISRKIWQKLMIIHRCH